MHKNKLKHQLRIQAKHAKPLATKIIDDWLSAHVKPECHLTK
jgi:hypothetical protein